MEQQRAPIDGFRGQPHRGQHLGQFRLPQQALQAAVVAFLVGTAGGAAAMQFQEQLVPPHRQTGRQRFEAGQVAAQAARLLAGSGTLLAP